MKQLCMFGLGGLLGFQCLTQNGTERIKLNQMQRWMERIVHHAFWKICAQRIDSEKHTNNQPKEKDPNISQKEEIGFPVI